MSDSSVMGAYLGMYQGTVANNADPLNEARVTMLIPQLLGNAESAWAIPSAPTNTVPPVGQTLWVQFSGGDITQPVYSPLGIKNVQDQVAGLGLVTKEPPKQPTGLTLSTAPYTGAEGATVARVQASWTAPTENQDGTPLTDLSHYLLQYSYDTTTWVGGTETEDTVATFDGLHTGVDVTVRIQAVDTSGNVSLWASTDIVTASSSTPPPATSAPGVTGVLGGLRVTWDGRDHTGAAMPAYFDHVQVQRDTTSAFASPVTVATFTGPDFLYDSVQNYASAYFYRLVAYSKTGFASAASASASATALQAQNQDLIDHAISEVKIQTGGLDASQVLKTGTITAASGIIGSIDAATITVGQIQTGQIAAGAVTANQMAAGTITASSGIIASIDASKITVGKITATQIDATNLQVAAANVTGQLVASQINASGLTISGSQVSGAVASATSASSATTVTGSIGAGVSVPGSQVSGTVASATSATSATSASSATTVTGSIGAGVTIPPTQMGSGLIPTTTTINGGSIVTGTVDASKLTISGVASNLLTDGGFEGAAGAALVATGGSAWSIDTVKFNGGAKSVKVNATSGSAATTGIALLTNVPAAAGDQVFLQTDWAATALAGSSDVGQKIFIQWKNSSGSVISFSVLTAPATLDGTWRTMSGTGTAPAGTVNYDVLIQIFHYTSVTAWYDNVIVRPVLGSTQIQAGAIQTSHLSATAIDGMTVTGATIRTASTGPRIVIDETTRGTGAVAGEIVFHVDTATPEVIGPASITSYGPSDSQPPALQITGPGNGGGAASGQPGFFQLTQTGSGATYASLAQLNAATLQLVGGVDTQMTLPIHNYADGTAILAIVQGWTSPALATGYATNGGSNGTPQYRVISFLGTNFVQWRGGVAITYSGGALQNSGNFLAGALPAAATPSSLRSMQSAAQWLSQWSVRVDFTTSGGTSISGTGTSYQPAWISLNGLIYSV